ncbi:MAG: Fic family protein [Oscillospiraceae bacterium]|nr:Fic family protein [Oscillospiraceae bacterium]
MTNKQLLEFLLSNNNYLEDFVTRNTYHSNAIEGSTLTYAETYAVLYNDNSFRIQNRKPREIYEIINHKEALELVFDNIKNESLFDEKLIKKINEKINKNILNTGGYRETQVYIRGSKHLPPPAEKVPNLIMYFTSNYNNDIEDIFQKIAKYHIQFESIHPFEDGNRKNR